MGTVPYDPRIKAGAYIKRDKQLWQVIGHERDDSGVTGKYDLENAHATYSSYGNGRGVWLHEHIVLTATEITTDYELVKPAPELDHLDRQMDAHLQATKVPAAGYQAIRSQPGLPKPKGHQ
jgi:hypothetical protein